MRYGRVVLGTMTMALSLAACGGEGGELREATERRRAALAAGDSAGDSAAVERPKDEEGFEIPAFSGASPGAAAKADSGAAPAAPAPGDTTPPAAAPAPTPEWTAGTVAVNRSVRGVTVLRDVRVGRNAGFDRVVLEFAGGEIPGYHVEYVDRPIRKCGSGDTTPVAGDAWLRIRLEPAQAHTDAGAPTVRERERALTLPVLREMEMICDFEGQVEVVLGVARPNRFRVTEVRSPGPPRLAIDVEQ